MKRMSEVFALPMTRHGNKLRDSYGEFICDFPDEVCAEFALSAFNNTDALADALAVLIKLVDDKEDGDMFRNAAYKESVHALEAYRGDK